MFSPDDTSPTRSERPQPKTHEPKGIRLVAPSPREPHDKASRRWRNLAGLQRPQQTSRHPQSAPSYACAPVVNLLRKMISPANDPATSFGLLVLTFVNASSAPSLRHALPASISSAAHPPLSESISTSASRKPVISAAIRDGGHSNSQASRSVVSLAGSVLAPFSLPRRL